MMTSQPIRWGITAADSAIPPGMVPGPWSCQLSPYSSAQTLRVGAQCTAAGQTLAAASTC